MSTQSFTLSTKSNATGDEKSSVNVSTYNFETMQQRIADSHKVNMNESKKLANAVNVILKNKAPLPCATVEKLQIISRKSISTAQYYDRHITDMLQVTKICADSVSKCLQYHLFDIEILHAHRNRNLSLQIGEIEDTIIKDPNRTSQKSMCDIYNELNHKFDSYKNMFKNKQTIITSISHLDDLFTDAKATYSLICDNSQRMSASWTLERSRKSCIETMIELESRLIQTVGEELLSNNKMIRSKPTDLGTKSEVKPSSLEIKSSDSKQKECKCCKQQFTPSNPIHILCINCHEYDMERRKTFQTKLGTKSKSDKSKVVNKRQTNK